MGNWTKYSCWFRVLISKFSLRARASAQGLLKTFTQLLVVCVRAGDCVAFHNPPGIGIHHKNRMLTGIEQDRICRLRAHPIQRKQFLPELPRGLREEAAKRPSVILI